MASEEVITSNEVGLAALPKLTTVLYAGERRGVLPDEEISGKNSLHSGVTATSIPTNTPTTGGEAKLLSCPKNDSFVSTPSVDSISSPNNADLPKDQKNGDQPNRKRLIWA